MNDATEAVRRQRPPAPTTVSEQARAFLSFDAPFDETPRPALDDTEAWLRLIPRWEAPARALFGPRTPPADRLARREREIGGVKTYILNPPALPDDPRSPLVLDIHGGGLYTCGGDLAWILAAESAAGRDAITWVPDYRMPPLHPYPAALDDCMTVYRAALEEYPDSRILIRGASAGGNLAAALLLRAKDEGLPMPAALLLLSPELDLTESGDSFRTNHGIDYLSPLMQVNLLYANGRDLAHPYLSPLFGSVDGFPPTLLQSGTRDLFLSNTVLMHRKLLAAGVETELHIFEAMPHGGFGRNSPEDKDLYETVRRFEDKHMNRS